MHNLVTAPLRASRHLAIWLVWQSTGVTLLTHQSPNAPAPGSEGQQAVHEGQEPASERWLRQAG